MKLNRHQVYALDELFNSYDEGDLDEITVHFDPHSEGQRIVEYELPHLGDGAPVSARLTATGELTPAPGQED